MSKTKLIIAMAAIACLSSAAAAGDHQGNGGKSFAQPLGYSWSGFYVRGHGVFAAGNTQGGVQGFSGLDTELDLDGGIYSGYAGYNFQSGAWVFGIEGTYSGSNIDANLQTPDIFFLPTFQVHQELDWLATIEGSIGYAFGRSMVYARGGWAWAELNTQVEILPGPPSLTSSETHTGWTAGFGFEHAVGEQLIARIEYSHVDLDTENQNLDCDCFFDGAPIHNDAELDIIRVGVSLKFGG